MNAKQRRKLLREQLQLPPPQQEESARITKKVEKEIAAKAVTQDDGGEQLNTEKRRPLARLVTQKIKVVTEKDETVVMAATNAITDGNDAPMSAQQRRLRKRRAKRKLEGVEETKPLQTKQWKQRKKGEDNNVHKSIHLTLFVGQLPFRATEGAIRKHFAEAGEIKLRMLTDKKTNKFKGTAFIEVKDSKALGAALSRHHTLLQGRRINVELTASGGGNKSEIRRSKLELLKKKQSSVQVKKTKALVQKHIDGPEYKLQQEDVDERMIDFLSWFDYETAKNALEEYNRCVSDRVNNRKTFFMGILKRFRQTDGDESIRSL